MTDDEFASAFERCEIAGGDFHHQDHIRLAWIYLKRYGPEDAPAQISASIRAFAEHLGKPDKYHETVTIAWMRLIEQAAGCRSFREVAAAFPQFLDKSYLNEFYSAETLGSEAARETFVGPDKKPLPSAAPSVVK
jgi:hypothetical protein